MCTIAIDKSTQSQTTKLGTVFLSNYLVTLDYNRGEMTFAVSANAVEGVTLDVDEDDDDSLGSGALIGLIVGAVFILLLILLALFCTLRCMKKKRALKD